MEPFWRRWGITFVVAYTLLLVGNLLVLDEVSWVMAGKTLGHAFGWAILAASAWHFSASHMSRRPSKR